MTENMDFINLLMSTVLIVVLGFQASYTQIAHYGMKAANKCFSVVGVPQLDFDQCNPDEMIQIVDAVQGIGQEPGQCKYQHGDCVEILTKDTEDKLANSCVGLPHCGITVSVAWMSRCRAYSSYNYALYKCIPKSDIVNICEQSTKKTKRNAYLMSPGYPDKYPASIECVCNITTEIDQRILLTFADFDLEWSENCESDILQITDGTTRMPRCGKLGRNYNITSRTHELQVSFKTDDWQQLKGFWLQIEVLGSLQMTCGPIHGETTTTTTTTTTTEEPTTNQEPDPTLLWFSSNDNDLYPNRPTDSSKLGDYNARMSDKYSSYNSSSLSRKTSEILFLVGIIVGCILIAVIIIIVVFLILWVKRRRHKESISHIPTETYYPKKRTYGDHSPRPGSPNSAGSVLSQGSDTDSARQNRSRNGTPKAHKSKN